MQLAYNDINDFSIARTDGTALAEAAVTTTPANAAYSYLAQDHLGTGRFVYNQSKTQTGAFEHYPYGARYSASGTAPYHEFTGKPWDADASLYYFPYRYYRPDMERWMSPDPAGLVDGPNVYGYVKENPVFNVDLLGLDTFCYEWTGKADINCRYDGLNPIKKAKCEALQAYLNGLMPTHKGSCEECKNKKHVGTIKLPDTETGDIVIKGDFPFIGEVDCKCRFKNTNVQIDIYKCDDCESKKK